MKWPRSGNFKMLHNVSLQPNSVTNPLRPAVLEAQADAGTGRPGIEIIALTANGGRLSGGKQHFTRRVCGLR
jgi:hypothetical protein